MSMSSSKIWQWQTVFEINGAHFFTQFSLQYTRVVNWKIPGRAVSICVHPRSAQNKTLILNTGKEHSKSCTLGGSQTFPLDHNHLKTREVSKNLWGLWQQKCRCRISRMEKSDVEFRKESLKINKTQNLKGKKKEKKGKKRRTRTGTAGCRKTSLVQINGRFLFKRVKS